MRLLTPDNLQISALQVLSGPPAVALRTQVLLRTTSVRKCDGKLEAALQRVAVRTRDAFAQEPVVSSTPTSL